MQRANAGGLLNLQRRQRAIGSHNAGAGVARPGERLFSGPERKLEIFFLHRPHAVVGGAGIDGRDRGSRNNPHQVVQSEIQSRAP